MPRDVPAEQTPPDRQREAERLNRERMTATRIALEKALRAVEFAQAKGGD